VAESLLDPGTAVVHLVEDDESNRTASARVLRSAGHDIRTYATADAFLSQLPVGAGCVVLDLRLPGASGLEVQERLAASDNPLPIVFLSGHGDIPASVRAMKAGAIDFLVKPVDAPVLLESVARALARDSVRRLERTRSHEAQIRYARLTPRERDVFAHLISGQLNKQIGFDLGITERTTKIHRHQVLSKMEANSVADLVRLAGELGVAPSGTVK
jgi:FixJ family two-component response regulator